MTDPSPLRPVTADLWEVEHHIHGSGLHARLRMTVVRLADGGLWLHSPVAIDDALAAALADVGPVRELVAPNRFHHLFAGAAKARYPDATLWGAPGLPAKRPKIPWDRELREDPPPWPSTLDALLIAGRPTFNEFVFHHRASRTLICTDLLFNLVDEPHWPTRALLRGIGSYRALGPNRVARLMTRDRRAVAESYRRILEWAPERILMAHGDVLEDRGSERLRAALGPLVAAAG